jgi:hypothetical protein
MKQIYGVYEEYGSLFLKASDETYLSVSELNEVIQQLLDTRDDMLKTGLSQYELHQSILWRHVESLARQSCVIDPSRAEFLEYTRQVYRLPEQHRYCGVYFITHPSMHKLIKIGQSTDIYSRMKSLYFSMGSVAPKMLLAIETPEPSALEKQLHQAFEGHRVQGEWFHHSGLIAWINSVKRLGQVKS